MSKRIDPDGISGQAIPSGDLAADWVRKDDTEFAGGAPVAASGLVVPIRSLGSNHRKRILRHLLALEEHDRYLRFGYHAQDRHIERYVSALNFHRDDVFGIYNRGLRLIAVAHLAYPMEDAAERSVEFGVSVLAHARGRGYGARLFERAAMHAANDGVDTMVIHALKENAAMLRIALRAGALLEEEGAEAQAHLRLSKASLETQLTELVDEQIAQADYAIKKQAMQFNTWFSRLQARSPAQPTEHV